MKPIHYILLSVTFCLVFGTGVLGIAFANKANCTMKSATLDAAGKSLKTWDKAQNKSCLFLDYGCVWTCENWCDKNLERMTAAEAKTAPTTGAAKFAYLCAMTTDAEENNSVPELKSGEVPLSPSP